MGGCLRKIRNITSHYMRYTIIWHDPPKTMEVKTHLNTSTVKLHVSSRVSPTYLKYIHMVEEYACSGGVIHSLKNNANLVAWPSILRVEFRSLISFYVWVVFHNKIRWKTWETQLTTLSLDDFFFNFRSISVGRLPTINP